jgi:hypothetical protein
MPFKRRLRLAFAALDHPHWAQEAVRLAEAGAGERIEPRAASPAETGILEWADLVLTLEDSAARALPTLPSRVQVRHLGLAGDAEARAAQIAERLRGIVGGLNLLARGDGGERT